MMRQFMRVVWGVLAEDGKEEEKDQRTDNWLINSGDKMEYKPQVLLEGSSTTTLRFLQGVSERNHKSLTLRNSPQCWRRHQFRSQNTNRAWGLQNPKYRKFFEPDYGGSRVPDKLLKGRERTRDMVLLNWSKLWGVWNSQVLVKLIPLVAATCSSSASLTLDLGWYHLPNIPGQNQIPPRSYTSIMNLQD